MNKCKCDVNRNLLGNEVTIMLRRNNSYLQDFDTLMQLLSCSNEKTKV